MNLIQAEKTALKELKSNENIIITKADKGGQIVILDKNHYIEGVNKLLNDGPYVTVLHDPSLQELKKKKQLLNLLTSSQIPPNPDFLLLFRFYALPKVNKPDIPFRPIISIVTTALYRLAKFLTTIFSFTLCQYSHP